MRERQALKRLTRRELIYAAVALVGMAVVIWLGYEVHGVRVALALALVLVVPGLGWSLMLRLSDGWDTLALASLFSISASAAVATTMAGLGKFSTDAGLGALVVIGLLGLLGWLATRMRLAAKH